MNHDSVTKIRSLFHEVKNKSGIIAGYCELYFKMLEVKDYPSMTQEELLKEHLDLLEKLKTLRDRALETDALATQLKVLIYKTLEIDNSKPLT